MPPWGKIMICHFDPGIILRELTVLSTFIDVRLVSTFKKILLS